MLKMPKTQTLILQHAASYVDGAILPLPEGLPLSAGAVGRTLGVLRKRGFVEKHDDGVWRITDAGREAVDRKYCSDQPTRRRSSYRARGRRIETETTLSA